jgi:type IV secretion system protein VirB8
VNPTERAQYYEKASSWADSERTALLRGARLAHILALAFAVVAGLEAFALILLLPLKTTTTVPILVDRQTGYVEMLKPDGAQAISANQALTNSLLAQYVVARESFNTADLTADYHKVALMSAGRARADYLTLMPASNPASPLRLYPRSSVVETEVKTVSPLGPATALVRFQTRRLDGGASSAAATQDWASVIAYRFASQALPVSDRWLNPLGFQVISYHRDAESVPAAASPAGQVAAADPSPAVAHTP